jgi:hypothetical protein
MNIETALLPGGTTSISSPNRTVPTIYDSTAIAAPVRPDVSMGDFSAGPNPAYKSSDVINFFWYGKNINNGVLTIFDATGNAVNTIKITDCADYGRAQPSAPNAPKRIIGTWDLTDAKSRLVAEGTYLVKGVITTSDGKKERVSQILGVR